MQLNRDVIKILMARNGLSVSAMAQAYGCKRQNINRILNSTTLEPRTVGKIAKVLQTDVSEIIVQ